MPELTEAEVARVTGKCESWCDETATHWRTADCAIVLRLIADWKQLRAENEEQGKILDATPGIDALGSIFEDMAEAGIDPNVTEKLTAERDSLRLLAVELVGVMQKVKDILAMEHGAKLAEIECPYCNVFEDICAALARAAEMGVGK